MSIKNNFKIKKFISTENLSKIIGVTVAASLIIYPMKRVYDDSITPTKSNKMTDKLKKLEITDEETINLAKKADAVKSFANANHSLCDSFSNDISADMLIKIFKNIDDRSIEKLSDEEFFTRIDDFIENVYYINKNDEYKQLSKDEKNRIKSKIIDEFVILNDVCIDVNVTCKSELTKKILSYRIGQIINESDVVSVEINNITSVKNNNNEFIKIDLEIDGREKTLISNKIIAEDIKYINNATLYNTTDKLSDLLDSRYKIESNNILLGTIPLNFGDYKDNICEFFYTYTLFLVAVSAGYLTAKGIQKVKTKEDYKI